MNVTESKEILSKPTIKRTRSRMQIFLDAYARTGRVNLACEAAHITPPTHYRKLNSDPVYQAAFANAEQQIGQLLEDTAVERAISGDSHLLLALLKRFRPALYREQVSTESIGSIEIMERLQTARARVIEVKPDDGSAS